MFQIDESPIPVAIRAVLGQTLVLDLNISDDTGLAIDLTGSVVDGAVIPAGGGAEIVTVTATTAGNVATIILPVVGLNPRRDYDYVLYLTRSGGTRDCIMRGPFEVLSGRS